ncbi:hypothetical protein HYU07_05115 [Candidatus Woesearchaeota archaeon]|nr:hypothetical protein [Candidatus Woesearchaeota archaeon]
MSINLPDHPFFEFVEKRPTLIWGKELYTASGQEIASEIGNLFVLANTKFRLEKIDDTLEEYDKNYMKEKENRESFDKSIEEEFKKQNGLNVNVLDEIKQSYKASYLTQVLNTLNPARRKEISKPDQEIDIEKTLSSLSILNKNFFTDATKYFCFNNIIYALKENGNREQYHVLFHGEKHSLYHICLLEDIKNKFNEACKSELKKVVDKYSNSAIKIIENNKKLKEFFRGNKSESEHYEEHKQKYRFPLKYGLKKSGETYYALLQCPPHAYVDDDGAHYVFEEEYIALRIPFKENGKADMIYMIDRNGNEIGENLPRILNKDYMHPAISSTNSSIRTVCYRGENYLDNARFIEDDYEDSIKSKVLEEDDKKAGKIGHILIMAGVDAMTKGLTKAIRPNTYLHQLPNLSKIKTTKEGFEIWMKNKMAEGYPRFDPVPVK